MAAGGGHWAKHPLGGNAVFLPQLKLENQGGVYSGIYSMGDYYMKADIKAPMGEGVFGVYLGSNKLGSFNDPGKAAAFMIVAKMDKMKSAPVSQSAKDNLDIASNAVLNVSNTYVSSTPTKVYSSFVQHLQEFNSLFTPGVGNQKLVSGSLFED